ncbi:MAG TPA: hypothetical protein VNW25_00240 [Candidatus Sulfotelmatobacter sp.]|nr:hypothetical protein [Candidatus Sulfotelmatobacter sp.]
MRRLSNPAVTVTLVLLVGIGIGVFAPTLLPTVPKVQAANVSIVLSGCVFTCPNVGWNGTTSSPNPTITVTRDDMVSLKLSSGDAITHRFLIDVDGDGGQYQDDCPAIDPCSSLFASTPTTYSFQVTLTPGTYTYYCALHPLQMVGKFVVNPDLSVGGTTRAVNKVGLVLVYVGPALAILGAIGATVLYLRRPASRKETA